LVEAAEQFKRALAQIATLPSTPAVRREQIKLQVALITPLIHVKGFTAPETKAAVERASRKRIDMAAVWVQHHAFVARALFFTLPMTACPPLFTWTCSTRTYWWPP
jgi:hypothetical protein